MTYKIDFLCFLALHTTFGYVLIPFHSMVCTIHDEFDSFCNCAEFTDNLFITDEWIKISDMIFKIFTVSFISAMVSVVTNYCILF